MTFIRLTIGDPYPSGPFGDITGFKYISRLALLRQPTALCNAAKREVGYVLAEPFQVSFHVDGREQVLTAPAGMLTDLVSAPLVLRSLLGRVGPHLEAAIVHDDLFIAWRMLDGRAPRRRDWRFGNHVMLAGLRRLPGFKKFKLFGVRSALWLGSWGVYRERDHPLFVEIDERTRCLDSGYISRAPLRPSPTAARTAMPPIRPARPRRPARA